MCEFQVSLQLKMSVVEREAWKGIAEDENSKSHCLAFIRTIKNISFAEGSKAHNFVDIGNICQEISRVKSRVKSGKSMYGYLFCILEQSKLKQPSL